MGIQPCVLRNRGQHICHWSWFHISSEIGQTSKISYLSWIALYRVDCCAPRRCHVIGDCLTEDLVHRDDTLVRNIPKYSVGAQMPA